MRNILSGMMLQEDTGDHDSGHKPFFCVWFIVFAHQNKMENSYQSYTDTWDLCKHLDYKEWTLYARKDSWTHGHIMHTNIYLFGSALAPIQRTRIFCFFSPTAFLSMFFIFLITPHTAYKYMDLWQTVINLKCETYFHNSHYTNKPPSTR